MEGRRYDSMEGGGNAKSGTLAGAMLKPGQKKCHESIILGNPVESRKSTQHLDAPDKIKNTLFTNQVTTVFLISPCTSICRLKAPTVGTHLFRAQLRFPGSTLKLNKQRISLLHE